MNYKIYRVVDASDKEVLLIDNFILDKNTNGEFINSIQYLKYHPRDRFIDDSIYIKDGDTGNIKCVFMAATTLGDTDTIISYPGTTFSGVVVDLRINYAELDYIVTMIENYYFEKYKKIVLRTKPLIYWRQPNQILDYVLLRKEFSCDYISLSNIINLSDISEDNIFEIYEPKRRNEIRKTIKQNKYEMVTLKEIPESIWGNMNKNISNKFNSHTTHSFDEINQLHHTFPNNIFAYAMYDTKDTYGAFALVYKFKNVIHTQYLDLNYDLKADYPNFLLIHKLLVTSIKDGFGYLSFGSSTENTGRYLNEGLFNYKKKYGAGSILSYQYVKNKDMHI